ncbi:MAG: PDZ domain-containing protein [Planctomycetota bacterium]
MNVATIKTLLFLVSLGLFGGLVYYAYEFKQRPPYVYFDGTYAKSVLDNVTRLETPQAHIVGYDPIVTPVLVKFDWTGAPPKKVEVVEDAPTGPVVKPKIVVSDLVTIQMVQVASTDPGASLALVAWKKPELQKASGVLSIGQKLPKPYDGAVVKDIRTDGIEFAFTVDDQEPEFVKVPSGSEGLISFVDSVDGIRKFKPRREIPTAAAFGPVWPERTREIARDVYEIGEQDSRDFERDYARILSEDVRTETFFKDGKRAGLKLTEVKPGSLAASHGATSGDVIISINGQPVSSEQEAIKFVKNNSANTTVWQVVVENLGRQRTVTYNTKKTNNS